MNTHTQTGAGGEVGKGGGGKLWFQLLKEGIALFLSRTPPTFLLPIKGIEPTTFQYKASPIFFPQLPKSVFLFDFELFK